MHVVTGFYEISWSRDKRYQQQKYSLHSDVVSSKGEELQILFAYLEISNQHVQEIENRHESHNDWK